VVDGITLDYLKFVFLASLGVIQVAAANSSLWGLCIIPKRAPSTAIGLALIAFTFVWFFDSGSRNAPGLEGAQLGFYFFGGATAAALSSLLLGSISGVLVRMSNQRFEDDPSSLALEGLEALEAMTFFEAMAQRWEFWRRQTRSGRMGP